MSINHTAIISFIYRTTSYILTTFLRTGEDRVSLLLLLRILAFQIYPPAKQFCIIQMTPPIQMLSLLCACLGTGQFYLHLLLLIQSCLYYMNISLVYTVVF